MGSSPPHSHLAPRNDFVSDPVVVKFNFSYISLLMDLGKDVEMVQQRNSK